MTQAVIECDEIQTHYVKNLNRPILNGVDCKINRGEFVVLLGLNGAGKSTLLKSFVGLVPIHRGEIRVNGTKLEQRSLFSIRQQVGMLFQGGGLIHQLSAVENVMCGQLGNRTTLQTLLGFPKQDKHHALKLLQEFGLQEHAYQKTARLSGGQQQRVAIARALIQSPEVLLADEPVTGLDAIASAQVMETLSDLHSRRGITIITVLHDLGMAEKYAQRAILLDAGNIVYDGSASNIEAQFAQYKS